MPLPPDVKLISCDDHVIEPPRLWLDRLPARYHDVAPRVVDEDDGKQTWVYEDQRFNVSTGHVRYVDGFMPRPGPQAIRFDQMRPGCYDPHARLADMDEDGVWSQLPFPTFARFGGHRFLVGKDKELALLCVQAYNDYVLDEWSAVDRERLLALGILPFWDVHLAAEEAQRIADKGAKAVAFTENPTILGLPSVYTDHWEPMWAALAETGIPVCMHIGSSSTHFMTSDDMPTEAMITLLGVHAMGACTDWLFSGIFERHPKLQAILSEGGAGWLPYILERADKTFGNPEYNGRAKQLPSETFNRNMYGCMITEPFALRSLDSLPVDRLLWESDYPHLDSFWPHSRKLFADALVDVPDEIAVKLANGNASKLFGLS
jgi:predicted TIM-barrel fold metal-dependent hydrolase